MRDSIIPADGRGGIPLGQRKCMQKRFEKRREQEVSELSSDIE